MRIGTKILQVLLMLFVFNGQVMAASGASSCDMDMYDMAMIDHNSMDMSSSDMDTDKMDCCDVSCALDCSLSMTVALVENGSIKTPSITSVMFTFPQAVSITNSHLMLFRPPISA
ncbi:MAG: hypothetical protein P8H57_03510 [Emcibacteraceae bacterium]|nr:hypothetical protein [Emcibacteraceae bacterium]MDG1859380.1 hypothetical protein [Emcibacteraceae bacterium]